MSRDSLSSSKPYIHIPSELESPALSLASYEFVIPAVEEAAQVIGQAMAWTTILLLVGTSVSQFIV